MIDEIRNTIICADCLEVLKTLPDKCVDLVLADPPYGVKYARGKNGWGVCDNRPELSDVQWDVKPTKEYFDEIRRVSVNQIIFGGNYFTDILPPTKGWIFWDKNGETKNKSVFADGELAWTSFNHVIRKYTLRVMGFINDSHDVREHPTQKPSELFVEILRDNSKEGDTVLDCFLGSGTTAVACYRTHRDFIGIEISPKYCEIARKRLQAEKDKLSLFPEAQ